MILVGWPIAPSGSLPVASCAVSRHRLNEDTATAFLSVVDGESEPPGVPAQPPRSRRRLLVVASGVACALVLSVVGWAFFRPTGGSLPSDLGSVPWGGSSVAVTDDTPSVSSLTGAPESEPPAPANGGSSGSTRATNSAGAAPTPTPTTPPTARAGSPAPTVTAGPSVTVSAGGALLPTSVNRSLQSVSNPDRYVDQVSNLAYLDQVTSSSSLSTRQSATFTIVPGLANSGCYSFRGTGNRYLRHSNYRLRAEVSDSSTLFKQDATFCAKVGSVSGSVLLEASNYAGYYVHRRSFELWVDTYQDTAAFRADSSFRATTAWS
jgi:hypothetical protein